jgi:hypothetical protein
VAPDVSVLFVDLEGCFEAAALGLPSPNEPSPLRDSAARESDVTTPTASWAEACLEAGSEVTYGVSEYA